MTPARWQFWIDRGGTFTDVVARAPDGALRTLKLLSECPEQYEDAALAGMRRLLGLGPQERITPALVECVRMGTTVATNALLERKGEPLLLVTTRGFRDALRIAYQARPRLFDREIVLPEQLYARVIEAQERMAADGSLVEALDLQALEGEMRTALASGLRACAIVFIHGWRYPAHELAAAALARRIGYTQVSVSHQVSPLMKLVGRGDTTVVDAYLSPILRRYVDRLSHHMPGVPLLFMQSGGGLAEGARFQGKDAVLSGPAGGIVGMARTGEASGCSKLIGFDMGGTSTDVSHYAGELERQFDTQVAGVRLRAPMLAIHTVAAGGGSIIRFDGERLRVGPESAGAKPGPASYRRGGPLTVTDANVLLGRLSPAHFPHLFGPEGNQPLDKSVVEAGFVALAQQAGMASAQAAAEGVLQIAVAHMAHAIKKISVARGHDLSNYTLQCFGGAGGQHACQVADALGMDEVLIHPLAGLLSAYGMGLAERTASRERALEAVLDGQGLLQARACLGELAEAARQELIEQGLPAQALRLEPSLQLRYQGSDTALSLPCPLQPMLANLQADFEAAYRRRFAFLMPGRPLVIESASVQAVAAGAALPMARPAGAVHPAEAEQSMPLYAEGRWQDAAVYRRERLQSGAWLQGPALITEANACTVLEPGWRASVDGDGSLRLRRSEARSAAIEESAGVDPVRLELYNRQFMNIAEQMGLRLQNTAHSVNIKERLDFSCAIFDAEGALIANAPHMPVHLGSMSESIRTVIERNPEMRPGDVFMLNDPYHGGTHLPDVTVTTPVFLGGHARPAFFVASRGHHADIGGITPGSMPPFSRHIEEEGVLFDNFLLCRDGRMHEAELRECLAEGPWPARQPDQNIADLRAQVAANEKGAQELQALVAERGLAEVQAYMGHVQANAESAVRRAIGQLRDGSFSLDLDNGARIEVAVRVDAASRSAVIDFTGSSAQQTTNNFNAPRSVTMAAVLYVFRTLVDDDIPLNAGCLRPLQLIVPEGSLLNPRSPAAVVAGNVETSSCVTNALYGALGVMAASQCTMNNLSFGNECHQYYETISGGSGAGPGFHGTAVVQTHMTNSRLTDPEVLEWRFPVRLESYEIAAGTGGSGQWRGGDGGLRRIRFLEPMSASILSNGRAVPAFGLAGGEAGAPGRNWLQRADGSVETLGHLGTVLMAPGDQICIQTPGGGGFGARAQSPEESSP
ncbi:hydantoinase B/oxoprolinase family protein [Roseateles microcysteis]|uniref:hydantoinase B/oxoprolinase family protein n=1 Tax=Roseateles microcysteis TaxID=3119057 RepID=UPI002FE5BCE1